MKKKKRKAWNKGKLVGDKFPFTQVEVKKIKTKLKKKGDIKGLVLFSIAIDSSLRTGDLLRLRASDVCSKNGIIKQEVIIQMEKTKKRVNFVLFKKTRHHLLDFMRENEIKDNDFLFAGRWQNRPMSKGSFRKFVKNCAEMIGLNPEHYSGHSTRRSRVIHLALKGMTDTFIAELIGVRVETVRHYIRRVALQMSKEFPM